MIITFSAYADLTKEHHDYLFKVLNRFGAVKHKLFFTKAIEQYRKNIAQAQVETFHNSSLVKSVQVGNIVKISRENKVIYSDLQCKYYDHDMRCDRKVSFSRWIGDNRIFNGLLYGDLRKDQVQFNNIKTAMAQMMMLMIENTPFSMNQGQDIFTALFLEDSFEGLDNPILFTLEQIREIHYKYVFEILSSAFFNQDYMRLATYGVFPLNHTANHLFAIENINADPSDVLLNYMAMIKKYELLNTDGGNDPYLMHLLYWEQDHINKLIMIRDFSVNNYDCKDYHYFSLDRLILKVRFKADLLNTLHSSQIFAGRGAWRLFLEAEPSLIYSVFKILRKGGSVVQRAFYEFVHTHAFVMQFLLRRNESEEFSVYQILALQQNHKYIHFMGMIVKHLHPTDYVRANRLFNALMGTLRVQRAGQQKIPSNHWYADFENSEFSEVLDYLCDKDYLDFSHRYTAKSLINHSHNWHRFAVSRIKIHPFSFPSIAYDILNTRFESICNEDELRQEINTMHHCIASYSESMANEKYIAFRIFDKQNDWRGTVGIRFTSWTPQKEMNPHAQKYHSYTFDQVRGPYNGVAPQYMRMACESLIARLMTEQPLIQEKAS